MKRRSPLLTILALGCLVAIATLTPSLSTAQTDKVTAAMADFKAKTGKLGVPKVEGKDLYSALRKWITRLLMRSQRNTVERRRFS